MKILTAIVCPLIWVTASWSNSKHFDEDQVRDKITDLQPIFECILPPEKYSVFMLSENYYEDAAVLIEQYNKRTVVRAHYWVSQGSGVCRFHIWKFNYEGETTLSNLGCYGETSPPENANGTLSLEGPSGLRRSYYCY